MMDHYNKYLDIEKLQQSTSMNINHKMAAPKKVDQKSQKKCPKCDEGMVTLEYGPMSIDKCQYCQGIWLKEGQLEQLCEHFSDEVIEKLASVGQVKKKKKDFKQLFHFEEKRRCPCCPKQLREVYFQLDSSIMIDICDHCQGVFYDQEELKKIVSIIKQL